MRDDIDASRSSQKMQCKKCELGVGAGSLHPDAISKWRSWPKIGFLIPGLRARLHFQCNTGAFVPRSHRNARASVPIGHIVMPELRFRGHVAMPGFRFRGHIASQCSMLGLRFRGHIVIPELWFRGHIVMPGLRFQGHIATPDLRFRGNNHCNALAWT